MRFIRNALGSLGVVVAFVAFGLLWSSAVPATQPTYPVPMAGKEAPRVWLVDGYNVVCSGLLGGRERSGWWQEEQRAELLERLEGLLDFLLPHYDREGKAYVTVGVGCTGGRHRSVAVASDLAARLRSAGREVNLAHRDLEREEGT